ncbi:signal recognition particle-docking protein FtsY [Psychromonas sp. Urea-02u-13]|uniref:signal recognition particle-docking protein FtsY n=1 Tax=Psychromonas sp. Urea-02u-13 TaxID=2058326 RepID=UPI000C34D650|nr:signal recognition particle-docking protein FtsY [Psychromonas sp. Urea-02u-13]PKG39450.1 signal recognition particle-docking protein FtsY [Psychromonas sp. Urea-02u-13]
MAKKKGMFSWFGKKSTAETPQETAANEKAALLKSLRDEALNNEDQDVEIILFDDDSETEKLAAEKLAAEKLEAEKLEAEKLVAEKLAAEKLEAEKLVAEKLAAEKLEADKAQADKAQADKAQADKAQADKADADKLEADKAQADKAQAEKLEAEKLEAEKIEAEKLEAKKLETEKLEAEKLEAEKLEAEKLEAEKLEAKKLEAEKLEAKKLEAEKLEAEKLEAEKLETEKLEAEKLEAEKLEAEKLEAEKKESVGEDYYEEIMFEENMPAVVEPIVEEPVKKKEDKALGFFARFKKSLTKTRLSIGSGLFSLFKGKKIDDDLFEELEEQLIVADIGVDTTLKIIDSLTEQANRKQLKDADALYGLLKEELSDILKEVEKPLVIDESKSPYVILMVGVNGVGKTTTIGKLAKQYQSQGKSVMLAAGDTFRAAAVEQLQVWGDRNNIPVIAQQTGADSASVLFDAMDAAKARGADVLIADTAGRLQNKDHLMDELTKVVRIMRKKDPTAPHEIMLTIDAGTGQNAISQVNLFNQAVGLTGITLTKLDGTAKGGIIFSIADKFKLPIRYIGTGEGIDDLREFNAKEFIDALFSSEEDSKDEN